MITTPFGMMSESEFREFRMTPCGMSTGMTQHRFNEITARRHDPAPSSIESSEELVKAVETMIEKAAKAVTSDDALKFSQAACNAANAICSINHAKAPAK